MPRPGRELGTERAQRDEPVERQVDRIDAELRLRPVGCDPSYSTRYQAKPRCASVTSRSVGSSTMAASGRGLVSADAAASASIAASNSSKPTEPNSSSEANASTRSPGQSDAAAAAIIAAASPPAMSYAPRPTMRSGPGRCSDRASGSADGAASATAPASPSPVPGPPTVSRCPASINVRPPPDPRRRASTLGRSGSAPTMRTSKPRAASHPAITSASSSSPAPPGTSDGLVASTPTSRRVSAATSSCGIRSPVRLADASAVMSSRGCPRTGRSPS